MSVAFATGGATGPSTPAAPGSPSTTAAPTAGRPPTGPCATPSPTRARAYPTTPPRSSASSSGRGTDEPGRRRHDVLLRRRLHPAVPLWLALHRAHARAARRPPRATRAGRPAVVGRRGRQPAAPIAAVNVMGPRQPRGSKRPAGIRRATSGRTRRRAARAGRPWRGDAVTCTPSDPCGQCDYCASGAELFDDVHAFLARFVAYPSEHTHVAHTLWIIHTHLMGAWESTPRIAFLSPEPGSGKTRALEVSELLVPRPVEAVNVTPAYLFRKVGDKDGRPTILFDEIDTVFGPKAKENEEIRGLLNAGHRRSGVAGRCVVTGKRVRTEEIPAYCAVALAGLGGLPDTLLSRAVVVRMRRRAPGEQIEPFRRRQHQADGNALRDALATWAGDVVDQVTGAWPSMPADLADRDADVWEPLLACADAAGGHWPQRARVAAVALVADSRAATPSLGVRLLADLREVFADLDAMSTDAILDALKALDESP